MNGRDQCVPSSMERDSGITQMAVYYDLLRLREDDPRPRVFCVVSYTIRCVSENLSTSQMTRPAPRLARAEKWLGHQDSNLGSWIQSPLPYRLAMPHHYLGL